MLFSFFASDFVSSHIFSPFAPDGNIKLAMSDIDYFSLHFEAESALEIV